MWNTIYKISDGLVARRFDLIDMLLFSTAWLLIGLMIGNGRPAISILLAVANISIIYVAISVIVSHIRRICFGRITSTDPLYGDTE